MEDAEALLEALSERIDQAEEREENAGNVGEGVQKLGNVGGVCIVVLAPVHGCGHWAPETACLYHPLQTVRSDCLNLKIN